MATQPLLSTLHTPSNNPNSPPTFRGMQIYKRNLDLHCRLAWTATHVPYIVGHLVRLCNIGGSMCPSHEKIGDVSNDASNVLLPFQIISHSFLRESKHFRFDQNIPEKNIYNQLS